MSTNEYPLHLCVFNNDTQKLKQILSVTKENIDQKDCRDRTPLELAVILNHYECAKILVENGADCTIVTKQGWNLVQESVSSKNDSLVKLIMKYREYQRTTTRINGIPELLNRLKQAPDFYVEMKWEFTSWIPMVAKACPSDVYKIYKSGGNVRIDTTLVGFNGSSWERGNKSFLFQANSNGATITEIDHLTRSVYTDHLNLTDIDDDAMAYEAHESVVTTKMNSPNMTTYLDIEKIEFERNKSGLWGWRSDKSEEINGYECKVYTANNLQLVTKTRVEHLSDTDRAHHSNDNDDDDEAGGAGLPNKINSNIPSFLSSFLSGSQHRYKSEKQDLSPHLYFNKHHKVPEYLNRKIDESRKIQTFNATLSLCEKYPLSLHEQLLPIVDLMALNNSHFKKLKEFITLQLPSGFPVKIEIPLYRVITAKVTFGNIHGTNVFVQNVRTMQDDVASKDSVPMCVVNEAAFAIPASYRNSGAGAPHAQTPAVDEDDILLQLAIQQSLSSSSQDPFAAVAAADDDAGEEDKLTAMEMLGHRRNAAFSRVPTYGYDFDDEDAILQRVLAESLITAQGSGNVPINDVATTTTITTTAQNQDPFDVRQALEISKREQERLERLQRQEEEDLERILALSLIEK